jgi:hypothetical protein
LSAIAQSWGEREVGFWNGMGVLFLARLAGRGVLMFLPDADVVTKFGISLPIYLGAIWAMLWLHCRVPPLRAFVGSVAVTVVVWVVGMVGATMLDAKS